MAFEANARIALPELVYINLDICNNKDEGKIRTTSVMEGVSAYKQEI